MKSCSHSRRQSAADFSERLRRQSRKMTGPRQAILKILHEHPHPLSSRELFSRLPEGECDLATIYRSLHMLESMGMVKRFDFGDNIARYELMETEDDGHHHHLVCKQCAVVIEIEACFPREWEEQIARENGFGGVTHKLEFFGFCPRCNSGKQVEPEMRNRNGQDDAKL